MSGIRVEEPEEVAAAFDIAPALAQEVVYVNDEESHNVLTPEDRWRYVRAWAAGWISPTVEESR